MSDRYLKFILTIIALELGWLGLNHAIVPASAQASVTPVVIRGIELGRDVTMPVTLARVTTGPLDVRTTGVVRIESNEPLRVETDPNRPLRVENVGYTGTPRPGE
jgi:hypothetical protein